VLQNYINTGLGQVCVNDYTDQMQKYKDFQQHSLYCEKPHYGITTDYAKLQYIINQEIKSETKVKKEEKKMAIAKNKRGLFQVILIDPREKKMLLNTVVISDSVEDVLLEVDAGKIIKDAGLAVSDVDKIINIIGQVRKTRKNKTGEVEIINEEEDTSK
jgi:hypothetical protein